MLKPHVARINEVGTDEYVYTSRMDIEGGTQDSQLVVCQEGVAHGCR